MAAKKSTIALSPDPGAPAEARALLRRFASVADPRTVEIAELLLTELVTNSMRHAQLSEEEKITVRLLTSSSSLRVVVQNPRAPADFAVQALGDPRVSGYGLALVERLASRWGINRDGFTEVWFELDVA